MVDSLTEHVLIAAIYATAAASRLGEDRPSPPLAQALQEGSSPGPTAEDIHEILHMRALPKTHPVVRPTRRLGAMDALPAHHRISHPQTLEHLVHSGVGQPRQGQTGSIARP